LKESQAIPEKRSNDREINNIKEIDEPPRIAKYHPPIYPFKAQEKGIQGRVKLRFTVDKTGNVQNPQVISAEPEGIFEQAALDTVMDYKFRPAKKDGKSVSSVVNLPMCFNLRDSYLKFAQK
jgi:protein TonB